MLEFRRKAAHMAWTLILAILIWGGVMTPLILFLMALAILLAALLYRRAPVEQPSLTRWMLDTFERPGQGLPAASAVTMHAGIGVALLFGVPEGTAAALILGVGDALACWVGLLWGRIRVPWNPKKHVEGRVAGAIAAAAAIAWLYPFSTALLVASAAMLAETLPRRWIIDDNLAIPVVAAALLAL